MTLSQRRGAALLGVLLALIIAFTLDHPIARAMAGMDPTVLRVARFVTWFGQGGVVLYPTGVLILIGLALRTARPDLRGRLDPPLRAVGAVFIIVAAAGLADDALKIMFGRARPYMWLKGDVSGFGFFRYGAKYASFPSGHTTTSAAAALAFGALFPRWRLAFLAVALAIALSRIVLGVHYLSDVVAGAALGASIALSILNLQRVRGWIPYEITRNRVTQDFGTIRVEHVRENRQQTDRN
jgi:membrane-associated phospholipid phosphatase